MPEVDGWDIVGLKKKKSKPTTGGYQEFATMEEAVEDSKSTMVLFFVLSFFPSRPSTHCSLFLAVWNPLRWTPVTYGMTATLHQLANEPSLGMYRLQVSSPTSLLLC